MIQGRLFPQELSFPEGFAYQPDFLTEGEHTELLRAIKREEFQAFDFHRYTAKRRTVEYGLEYDFGIQRTSATKPFPEFLLTVRERAAAFAGVSPESLVEGMILEYPPGAPIGWHRDAPQFGTIIGISLLSAARMRLRPYRREGKIVSVTLEPRSIYVLLGAARWQWQHSIPAGETMRYSVPFAPCRRNGNG